MFKSLTLIPSKRLQFERFKILIIKLTPNLIPLPLEAVPETLSQTIHDTINKLETEFLKFIKKINI